MTLIVGTYEKNHVYTLTKMLYIDLHLLDRFLIKKPK